MNYNYFIITFTYHNVITQMNKESINNRLNMLNAAGICIFSIACTFIITFVIIISAIYFKDSDILSEINKASISTNVYNQTIDTFTCYSQSDCSIEITKSYNNYFNNININSNNYILITHFSFLHIKNDYFNNYLDDLLNINILFIISHILLLFIFVIGCFSYKCIISMKKWNIFSHVNTNNYYLLYYLATICIGMLMYLATYYIFLLPQLNIYNNMRSFGFPNGASIQTNTISENCTSTITCFNKLLDLYKSNGYVNIIMNNIQYKGPVSNHIYLVLAPICFCTFVIILIIIEYNKINLIELDTDYEFSQFSDSDSLIQNINSTDHKNIENIYNIENTDNIYNIENTDNGDYIYTYTGPRSQVIDIIKSPRKKYSESF